MNSGLRRKLCQILCECVLFAVYTFKSSLYQQTLDQQRQEKAENWKWKLETELEKLPVQEFQAMPRFPLQKAGRKAGPAQGTMLNVFSHYHSTIAILRPRFCVVNTILLDKKCHSEHETFEIIQCDYFGR